MANEVQFLRDELRASRRREEELLRQIKDLTDRVMFLSGKPYVPTPLEEAQQDEPERETSDPWAGFTEDREAVGL